MGQAGQALGILLEEDTEVLPVLQGLLGPLGVGNILVVGNLVVGSPAVEGTLAEDILVVGILAVGSLEVDIVVPCMEVVVVGTAGRQALVVQLLQADKIKLKTESLLAVAEFLIYSNMKSPLGKCIFC